VLSYVRAEDKHYVFEQRFVEVDRATLSVERLVAELARYGQLCRARDKRGESLWSSHYPTFPAVICALTGASRKSLTRRRNMALVLLEDIPQLSRAYGVTIGFCLLDDLRSRGPFAPIFREVGALDRSVDWLGQGEDDEGQALYNDQEARCLNPAYRAHPGGSCGGYRGRLGFLRCQRSARAAADPPRSQAPGSGQRA
jgi:hypothetical protein